MIKLHHFAYLAFTVYGATFQRLLLTMQFLTLFQLVSALDAFCRQQIEIRFPQKVICMSQPPNNIRLTTYSYSSQAMKQILESRLWITECSLFGLILKSKIYNLASVLHL